MEKVRFQDDGCWIWTGSVMPYGYGQFRGDHRKEWLAHRVSYSEFVDPIPEGMQVCHKCDVKLCVNPEHLFLGTQRDNMRDMASKGRASMHNAKVTAEQVAEIRSLYATHDWTCADLAKNYGISPSQLHRIVTGQRWRETAWMVN